MNSTNKNNSNVVESENIIELKNITKQYEDLVVLDNLNLDIKKNEFLTLLGPSGCGKTTTLKIIAGFEHADEGEVMFEGENVNDTPPYERQVNTVFQKYALFPHMNVYENIAFGLKIKKMDKALYEEDVKSSLIVPAGLNKDGSLSKSTNSVTYQEFEVLRKYVKHEIKELCEGMLGGDISINPNKHKDRTSCDFCIYNSICQFDPTLKDNNYNIIKDKKNEEIIRMMAEEVE